VLGVSAVSASVVAPLVRADASWAPALLSSIWNRARLAPLNKLAH
jgi:hypothetical protein